MLRSRDFWVGAIVGVAVVTFVLPRVMGRRGARNGKE